MKLKRNKKYMAPSYIRIVNLNYYKYMEICLQYFLRYIPYYKYYFNYFKSYIYVECRHIGKYPTYSEIKRFLKREISFNNIRDMWDEIAQDSKTDEDYKRIFNDRFQG